MNKQKKTKLMAALSLLLTCAPCNFANATETEANNKESITEIKVDEENIEHSYDFKKIDDITEKESIPIKLTEKSSKKKNNSFDNKFGPTISEDMFKMAVKKYNESKKETIIGTKFDSQEDWTKMGDVMKKKRRRDTLVLAIGIPTSVAVLGGIGFGVYKGIKKMKKDGKPQPTKNVENKGKKLVSPNVKSN